MNWKSEEMAFAICEHLLYDAVLSNMTSKIEKNNLLQYSVCSLYFCRRILKKISVQVFIHKISSQKVATQSPAAT